MLQFIDGIFYRLDIISDELLSCIMICQEQLLTQFILHDLQPLYDCICLYTFSKNDIISSVRKRFCALGLEL